MRAGEAGLHRLTSVSTPLAEHVPVSQVVDLDLPMERRRNDDLASHALAQALAEAGLQAGDEALAGAALLVGSITGDTYESEKRYRDAALQWEQVDLLPQKTNEASGPTA